MIIPTQIDIHTPGVWLANQSPAFRLLIATSWLAPEHLRIQQEKSIRTACAAGVNWIEYLRLINRHRTPALCWAALKRVADLNIPDSIIRALRSGSDDCHWLAMSHLQLLATLLKTLSAAGIPALALKGPLLSLELYGDPCLRHSKDIDIEVPVEQIHDACQALLRVGNRLNVDYTHLTPSQWKKLLRFEHHLDFIHPNGTLALELHWRHHWNLPGTTSDQWANSHPVLWQGCSYRALDPIDQILYLCSHGAEHLWFRAKWLGDIARIRANNHINWLAAHDRARRTHQERPLLAALRLLEIVYDLPLPDLPASVWRRLPPQLVDAPLRSISATEEPMSVNTRTWIRNRTRAIHYNMLLFPRKTLTFRLAELLYSRADFIQFPLSNNFFWAYAPLRPIFWIIRRTRPFRRQY